MAAHLSIQVLLGACFIAMVGLLLWQPSVDDGGALLGGGRPQERMSGGDEGGDAVGGKGAAVELAVPCGSIAMVLEKIERLRVPAVITVVDDGSVACQHQPGVLLPRIWTREMLGSQQETLQSVGCHSKPHFTYNQMHRPMANLTGMGIDEEPRKVSMSSASFFSQLDKTKCDDCACPFMYYAQSLSEFSPTLAEQTQLEGLRVPEPGMEEARLKSLIWIGSEGVTTRLHYDWSHNVHVMVSGSKTFFLYPPSNVARLLHLFPYLHPLATKMQVDPHRLFNSRFAFLQNQLDETTVVLKEGQLLYLPPLWGHSVHSNTPTVSLAVWTESLETLAMNEALRLGMPAHLEGSEPLLDVLVMASELEVALFQDSCTRVSLSSASSSALSPSSPFASFVSRLLHQRYESLPDKQQLESDTFQCPVREAVCNYSDSMHGRAVTEFVHKELLPLFFAVQDESRREVWLGDYVEVMLHHVVGGEGRVLSQLRCVAKHTCAC